MENRATFTSGKLRNLCIKNNWFTAGTNEQYEKLFFMNSTGVGLEMLATIIWICSEDVFITDVLDVLCDEKKNS